jgi:hypothetical protein
MQPVGEGGDIFEDVKIDCGIIGLERGWPLAVNEDVIYRDDLPLAS